MYHKYINIPKINIEIVARIRQKNCNKSFRPTFLKNVNNNVYLEGGGGVKTFRLHHLLANDSGLTKHYISGTIKQ